jgi:hypothetical protein
MPLESGAFAVPIAIVVVAALVIVAGIVALRRRRRAPGADAELVINWDAFAGAASDAFTGQDPTEARAPEGIDEAEIAEGPTDGPAAPPPPERARPPRPRPDVSRHDREHDAPATPKKPAAKKKAAPKKKPGKKKSPANSHPARASRKVPR